MERRHGSAEEASEGHQIPNVDGAVVKIESERDWGSSIVGVGSWDRVKSREDHTEAQHT